MSEANKNARSKSGYPIVYKRYAKRDLAKEHGDVWNRLTEGEREVLIDGLAKERWAENQKEGEKPGAVIKGQPAKRRKIGKLSFSVSADNHSLQLTIGSHKTYHRTLGSVAACLHRRIVKDKIADEGAVADIKKLIEIERSATSLILKAFDTLPSFEVNVI